MKRKNRILCAVLLAAVVCAALVIWLLVKPKTSSAWPKLEDIQDNYSQEQAISDGCVVLHDSDVISGEAQWLDFVNLARSGKEAAVRLYQTSSLLPVGYFVEDLRYDGEQYLRRFYDQAENSEKPRLIEKPYKYLVRDVLFWEPDAESGTEYYLLTDSADITAKGFAASLASSSVPPEDDHYSNCWCIYGRKVDSETAIQTAYGAAFADIDGDGVEEKCCLGVGPTSGIFTFTLTVYQEENLEYECVYCTEFYHLNFVQDETGKLLVQAVSQGTPSETHLFDLVIENHAISLVCGEEKLLPA